MPMTEDMLTTAQVARYLGVKTQTVYAYVSRGILTSHRRPGHRTSWFALADVEALRQGTHGDAGTGVAESIRTLITSIEADDSLLYRGRPADELAEAASLEQTAGLLWQVDDGEQLDLAAHPEGVARVREALAVLPETARHVDRLRLGVLVLGAHDVGRCDLSPEAVRALATRLLNTLATALLPGPHHDLGDAPLATRWAAIAGADPHDEAQVDLVRRVMVLHADHDFATSTTAVRAAASVHADPYSCLLAGLAAIDSPLHGSAGVSARLAIEATAHDPAVALAGALAESEPPAGFGHRVYRERDPRAEHLLAHLRETAPGPAERAAAMVEDGLMLRHGWFPNSDWALALVAHQLRLPTDAAPGLFAAARTVGWVAHIIEEYGESPLRFRLNGVYTGPR